MDENELRVCFCDKKRYVLKESAPFLHEGKRMKWGAVS